jgi:ketosteroid isomerase-like protein
MRKLLIGGVFGIIVLFLAACGDSSVPSAAEQELQRKADLYEIDQIEKRFHQATTMKDIDLMMGLWAPNATLTVGPGDTAAGVDQIRRFWLNKSAAFMPETHWVSDHPAYKVEITVNGDRGTLHFECHYVDYRTHEVALVTVADQDVARIDGRWLITNMVAGSTTLAP